MTLSTTERATESMVGPEERTQDVPAQDPAAPEIAPVRVAFGRADALAMLVLAVLSVALFGPHVLGLGTFIGNSDRLHSFLNVRELVVHAFQTVGRVPAWTDLSFMGLPVYGLHWMFPGLDGVAAVMALFPEQAVFRVAGYVSAAYVVCAALAAYLLIRDVVRSPFPALIGAALYVCSTFAVHRISQVDSAFAVLIFQPIGLLILRRLRTGRLAIGFVGLVAVVVGLAGFTFLQETAYMLIFLGLYACYRLVLVH